RVIGLFIANNIDSNTAETFRIGVWYDRNDNKMKLDIIPLTLLQFKKFFSSCFNSPAPHVNKVIDLLDECNSYRENHPAPIWKEKIDEICTNKAAQYEH